MDEELIRELRELDEMTPSVPPIVPPDSDWIEMPMREIAVYARLGLSARATGAAWLRKVAREVAGLA